MRRVMAALAVALVAISVASCGGTSSDSAAEKLKQQALKVQDLVLKGCSIKVKYDSVIGMLTASNPTATGVNAIATAVCQAWTAAAKQEALVGQCPQVNGVCIEVEGQVPPKRP